MRKSSRRVAQSVASSAVSSAVAELVRAQSVSERPSKETALNSETLDTEDEDKKAAEQGRFRRRFSVKSPSKTSLGLPDTIQNEEEEWITLTPDDEARISAVHETNPRFSRYELQRVFAAVKENGGSLTREEFAMVYVTYAQLHDHNMALRVFDLLDANNDNAVSFEEFVPFLEVMIHGTRENKATFCFQLYDRDRNGKISKHEFVNFLTKLPVNHIMEDFEKTRPGARSGAANNLPSLTEEDEETEDAELAADEEWHRRREAEEKKAADEKIRKEMIKSFRKSRGELLDDSDEAQPAESKPWTLQDTKDKINQQKAQEVAEQIFEELGEQHDISLEEFILRVNTSPTLQAFFPF